MKTKQFQASFKSVTADGVDGRFEAVVAVFDNVDKVGDRLKSTAFDATLKSWRESGDPIPVILAHKWDDPMAIIGHADPQDVKAIPGKGLYVKGQLHIGRGNEVADQVYHLMSERLLKEFSFGFTVPQGGESRASDGAYDIKAVNLIEFGPCLKGVNPETELLVVKSMERERPRTKSYVDVEVAGSFEETQDNLQEALEANYAPTDSPDTLAPWVCLVATTPTEVTYQVHADGEGQVYRASYEIADDGTVNIGEPAEVEVSLTPVTKSDDEIETKASDVEQLPVDTFETVEIEEINLEPEKSLDVLVYEAAIANLEAKHGQGFDTDALETARLDADLDALLGD